MHIYRKLKKIWKKGYLLMISILSHLKNWVVLFIIGNKDILISICIMENLILGYLTHIYKDLRGDFNLSNIKKNKKNKKKKKK